MNSIVCGDALEELKNLEENSIDTIISDPPYGYSFMGKDWDKAVPSVETWKECLRVLKPGAFCCVMSAPRSDVQMHMIQNLTEAGFRLDFTPIYWTYASGFPKAGNIGKMVDKRLGNEREVVGSKTTHKITNKPGGSGGSFIADDAVGSIDIDITRGNSELEGSYAGFQPKPAVEVIIIAMKPLSEKTFVDQALKNKKGISWLDDGRIPGEPSIGGKSSGKSAIFDNASDIKTIDRSMSDGRFTANLLVSDDALNTGKNIKSGGDVSGKEPSSSTADIYGDYGERTPFKSYSDLSSYSRYFNLDAWWAKTLPFLMVPKASKSEKNKGVENFEQKKTNDGRKREIDNAFQRGSTLRNNNHPTVKPLKLMSYLITLFSRENDIVLDPFVGSGTTCLAAKKLKRKYIGIDKEPEYVEIAKARLEDDKQEVLL